MDLHFILLVEPGAEAARAAEFAYVQDMARFFAHWARSEFSQDLDPKSDMMAVPPRGPLRRLDTHELLDDHRSRGRGTYHFYLANFRPFWTDCTCEGYHAENFGMVWWRRSDDERVLAEKNCTAVSHEMAHELLRRRGAKARDPVHDVWTRHFYDGLPFCGYDSAHARSKEPRFLTLDAGELLRSL